MSFGGSSSMRQPPQSSTYFAASTASPTESTFSTPTKSLWNIRRSTTCLGRFCSPLETIPQSIFSSRLLCRSSTTSLGGDLSLGIVLVPWEGWKGRGGIKGRDGRAITGYCTCPLGGVERERGESSAERGGLSLGIVLVPWEGGKGEGGSRAGRGELSLGIVLVPWEGWKGVGDQG